MTEKRKVIKRLVCPKISTPMDMEWCRKEKCEWWDPYLEQCIVHNLRYLKRK